MKSVVLIGAGGSARSTLDIIDAVNQDKPQYEVLGYIVDAQYGAPGTMVNNKPILGGFEWLAKNVQSVFAICTVGPSHHRYRLVKRAEELGCHFFSIIHPSVIMTRWVEIGRGTVVAAGCILTNQIHIGNHVQINLACTVEHDDILEDFTTLSPGVNVSGNVTLKTGAFVGTGACIIEKTRIGRWSTIGAGGVVIRDVLENSTVVGNPSKIIKQRPEGWHIS